MERGPEGGRQPRALRLAADTARLPGSSCAARWGAANLLRCVERSGERGEWFKVRFRLAGGWQAALLFLGAGDASRRASELGLKAGAARRGCTGCNPRAKRHS
jgi:hypothetical protein